MCWGMTRPVYRCARRACLKKGPACGTLAPQRGKGYAGAMMREMCREAAARGGRLASLGAQVERESFYAALGFSPVGEVFLDCGQPHIEMQKAL